MLTQIINAILVLGILGFIFGAILSYASVKFKIETDPRIDETLKRLPGANCGSCGFAGCAAMAEAIITKGVSPTKCPVMLVPDRIKLEEFLGLRKAGDSNARAVVKAALVKCQGLDTDEQKKFNYMGLEDCQSAVLVQNGPWLCPYRCIGLGSCVKACKFGAIKIGPHHLPEVDQDKCVGCGQCVMACPKHIIDIVDTEKTVHVRCNSVDKGADTRKLCKTGCLGCGICAKNCAYDAIIIENNLARIDYEKCHDCGACVTKCPTGAIIKENRPNYKGRVAEVNQDLCVGCTLCFKNCKFSAIVGGKVKEKHSVDAAKCVGCGMCADKCPKKAIVVKDRE